MAGTEAQKPGQQCAVVNKLLSLRCVESLRLLMMSQPQAPGAYKIFRQKGVFVYLNSANHIQEVICNHDSTERLFKSLFVFIAENTRTLGSLCLSLKTFFHFFPSSSFLSAAACIIFCQLDLTDGQFFLAM